MKQWVMPAVFAISLCVSLTAATFGAGALGILLALILPASAWYLLERQNATKIWFLTVLLVAMFAIVAIFPTIKMELTSSGNVSGYISLPDGLKKFSSQDELENFVTSISDGRDYGDHTESLVTPAPASITRGTGANRTESDFGFTIGDDDYGYTIDGQTPDFSTTNIQVEGVDEADIVKTDGEYIYVVSGDKVFIIDAYPAEDARILSEVELNENPVEIYINGDKLTVIGWRYLKVYDVSDRGNPVLKRDVSFDGYYFNSRMIGDYVYVVINSPAVHAWVDRINLSGIQLRGISRVNLPDISCNGRVKIIPADEIYYFDGICGYSYEFTTIMAIDSQDDGSDITSKTFLMSTAQNIFVSTNNVYITYTSYANYPVYSTAIWRGRPSDWTETTVIHKIAIGNEEIEYKARGEVPGQVLNQFSMDEYQGYFRIATTTDWYGANHIYVLDDDLDIVGRLENIAPGERIYSARFMSNRVYLVTFVMVDPLFVIDLADPTNPRVLGELKIPGYSDYLHPYDETHLIGVGKDTTESSWGALYQGVKIALFDVSDPENPREVSKYIVGQRGTDSLALHDHRAFLFSKSRNLLVMPIGGYWTQDAYVFHISVDDGIALKGTVTHGEYSVKRSLYIEDVLYTISDGLVKMNDLTDLSEINNVELPLSAQWPLDYYRPMI